MSEMLVIDPDELRTKSFNKFIDQLLLSGKVDDELWTNLTQAQKEVYSVINRSFARIQRNNS